MKLCYILAASLLIATPAFAQGYPNPHNPNIQTGGNGNGNNGCGNGNGGNSGNPCHPGTATPPSNGGSGGNGGNGGNGGSGGTSSSNATATSFALSQSGVNATLSATGGNSTAVGLGGNSTAVGLGGNATGGNSVATGGNATGGNATTGPSSASTSNANNSSVNVEGDSYTQRRQVATAYAPALAAGLGTCLGSTSGGGQTGIFGISFGKTHTDKNCVLIQQVSLLNSLGLRDAAIQRACADVEIRRALAAAGTGCDTFVYRPVVIPVEPTVVAPPPPLPPIHGERG